MIAYTPGQYATPAAITLQPPMWVVQARSSAVPALAQQLVKMGVHFGQISWGRAPDVMIVVFASSPLRADVRAVLEQDGRNVRGWDAHLDVDGTWEEYRP